MGRGSDTFISLLGQKEVDSLVARYEINLSLFEVRVPCSGERASSPREGEIAIYQDALLRGLRLHFSDFAKAILEEYHLCPSQLASNSWRLLNGFVIVFKHYGISPIVRWFRMLFSLCLESNADWYYFSARSGRKLLGKVPSSIKRWKSKFFFVKRNPMEDEDLSYVKGLLASFEAKFTRILASHVKKKEVVLGQGVDTSKEERKKRKRKETDSSKKGAGSSRERRTKRKNSEDISGPGIAEEQTAHWADRVGNLCQEDLAKMEMNRADIAQLSSRVAALEEKEKEQLDAIRALERDKSERLRQLAAMEKEKADLAAQLSVSKGSLLTAEETIKGLQNESSSLKKELQSTSRMKRLAFDGT
uniref:Transposase (putative) gypsy type domain-containing protein n=1 Tax=Dioscorea zingiberensis TaxID=325984 RepID=A0A9D5BWU6_9LILI|nr:hypothetical protein J5N97_030069 [Dioscorea zingiberensis]